MSEDAQIARLLRMDMIRHILEDYKEKKIWIPLLLIAAFIIASRINPTAVLHYYAALYILLILYAWRVFFTPPPKDAVTDGRNLLIAFVLTVIGLFIAHLLERALVQRLILAIQDDGVIDVTTRETADFFLYIIVMMFLVPLGEGLLFRGLMVSFRNKKETALTVVMTIVLSMLIHADGPAGIPVLLLPLIPLTVCYLTTKNTRLCILEHILYSIYDNYEFVSYAFARIIYQYN